MIGFIIALIYFILFIFAIGTTIAFFTSWRDGCLQRDIDSVKSGLGWVFLRIKKFAQVIFNRTVYGHITSYWMYYCLLIVFIAVALSE